MPFEKGKPRHPDAGRKKGTPNKRNTIFESLENIKTEDGDTVDLVKIFVHDLMSLPAMQRAEVLVRFFEYVYPKQRNIETTGEMGIKVIVEKYLSEDK